MTTITTISTIITNTTIISHVRMAGSKIALKSNAHCRENRTQLCHLPISK